MPVHHERGTVEHQFILTADQVRIKQRNAGRANPLAHHRLAVADLAGLIGRGVEIQNQPGPGRRGLLHRARLPDVLANGEPDRHAAQLEHTRRIARLEIALFVEDAVIGQPLLAVGVLDGAIADHCRAVVHAGVGGLGKTDDDGDAVDLSRQPLQGVFHGGQKIPAQNQILGRIAGQRQLREHHRVRAQPVARLPRRLQHPARIAGHVADEKIQLGNGDAKGHGIWLNVVVHR